MEYNDTMPIPPPMKILYPEGREGEEAVSERPDDLNCIPSLRGGHLLCSLSDILVKDQQTASPGGRCMIGPIGPVNTERALSRGGTCIGKPSMMN